MNSLKLNKNVASLTSDMWYWARPSRWFSIICETIGVSVTVKRASWKKDRESRSHWASELCHTLWHTNTNTNLLNLAFNRRNCMHATQKAVCTLTKHIVSSSQTLAVPPYGPSLHLIAHTYTKPCRWTIKTWPNPIWLSVHTHTFNHTLSAIMTLPALTITCRKRSLLKTRP